jgi:hypothetical protein
MNDEPGFVATVLRDLLASTAVILAACGALGGATNDAHHEDASARRHPAHPAWRADRSGCPGGGRWSATLAGMFRAFARMR